MEEELNKIVLGKEHEPQILHLPVPNLATSSLYKPPPMLPNQISAGIKHRETAQHNTAYAQLFIHNQTQAPPVNSENLESPEKACPKNARSYSIEMGVLSHDPDHFAPRQLPIVLF
jgi:hypothetical protein